MKGNSTLVLSFAPKQHNVHVAQMQVNQLSLISLHTFNIYSANFLALKSRIFFKKRFKGLLMMHRSFADDSLTIAIREFKKLLQQR